MFPSIESCFKMVEARDIQRYDFRVPYENGSFKARLAIIRLWDDAEEDSCSRFNIQLKLRNKQAVDLVDDDSLNGGTWTVVAHSDHNPNGGHNIRDSTDEKQLHIDVHPHVSGKGYNNCHSMLTNGRPPEVNDEAIQFVEEYMRNNADAILRQYFQFFD